MAGYLSRADITIVDSFLDDLDVMIKELLDSQVFAFDLENEGPTKAAKLDPFLAMPCSFQFSTGKHHFYVPFENCGGRISIEKVLAVLLPVFQDPEKTMLGHNIKFDLKHLAMAYYKMGFGFAFPNIRFIQNKLLDTMVADWILDENDRRHGLDHVAEKHLGIKMLSYDEADKDVLLGSVKVRYGADDVAVPWRLWHEVFVDRIEAEGLFRVFHWPKVFSFVSGSVKSYSFSGNGFQTEARYGEEQDRELFNQPGDLGKV